MVFIFFTLVCDIFALGLIIPVLPLFLQSIVGDTATTARWVGIFGFIWAFSQFFMAPIWGALSDRFGRRSVILSSCFFLALDHLITAFATSLTMMLLARTLSAIFAANYGAIYAYVADITPSEKRARAYGIIGAAWGLGFILGPAISGYLAVYDLRYPFLLASALTFINVAYGLWVLPESLPRHKRRAFSFTTANPLYYFKLWHDNPTLKPLVGLYALYQIGHYSLSSLFVLYCSTRYAWGAQQIGLSLAYIGLLNAAVQGFAVGRVVKRWGEWRTLRVGFLMGCIGFVGMASAHNASQFFIAVTLFSLVGFANPSLQSLMSKNIGDNQQGQMQGSNAGINALCGFFAPLMFTYIFAYTLNGLLGAGFYLAAFINVAALVLSYNILKNRQ